MILLMYGISETKWMNKQNRNKLMDTEKRQIVVRLGWLGGLSEKDEGIKQYKLTVTEQSGGCKVE